MVIQSIWSSVPTTNKRSGNSSTIKSDNSKKTRQDHNIVNLVTVHHAHIYMYIVYSEPTLWCEALYIHCALFQARHACLDESRHKEVKALKDEIRALQVRIGRSCIAPSPGLLFQCN